MEDWRKQLNEFNLSMDKTKHITDTRIISNADKNKSTTMREKVSKGNKGKIRTDEYIKNLTTAIGKITSSSDWKEKHSEGIKKRADNKQWRNNVGGWNKGIPRNIVVCPHCGKEGGEGIMNRWHFDNCKHK